MKLTGRIFSLRPPGALAFQLLCVSFPEEVYFRGFLQERLGNTVTAVITVSLLFALMHLPSLIFHGDILSVLTFFPSLVMGLLYMRTSNVIASTIFHFAANTVFLSFFDMS
ncbi:MAG TPA: CPBP family intramembrane glutamic endopeptidase [Thermodesulfovibrionales bacterium]|nr:CPBP family intramembrane glutamic endopeptidase [Thermodesulfovibrionales bacterium]